jgi:hypothetical protein
MKAGNKEAIEMISRIEADSGALISSLMGPPEKRPTAA